MPDRKKAIRGLEFCSCSDINMDCPKCPYYMHTKQAVYCMDRLMRDALALLKEQEERELGESCDDCSEYDEENHRCPKFCRVIRETVDEIKPRWIPVTEQLPEEGKDVIALEKQGFPYIDFVRGGEWVIASDQYAIVTHWMPLPEPPKEEDRG